LPRGGTGKCALRIDGGRRQDQPLPLDAS
jgi:hypothetical protein